MELPYIRKEITEKMSTRNRLDFENTRISTGLPNNLPRHCLEVTASHFSFKPLQSQYFIA